MDGVTAYDDDFYAWAHEQAAVLRRMAETRRDLPNELDVENVAEEMEGLARSDLNSAESFLRLLLLHLLKIASAPDAPPSRHWRAEAKTFQASFVRIFSRSMLRKMDAEEAWRLALEQAAAQLELEGDALLQGLPDLLPLELDALSAKPFNLEAALDALREAAAPKTEAPSQAGP